MNTKNIIYNGLLELTRNSNEEKYFSKAKIHEHIKNQIEENFGIEIYYRRGYLKNKNNNYPLTEIVIDLEGILPKTKELLPNLEELVSGRRVEVSNKEFVKVNLEKCSQKYYKARI